MKRKNTSKSRFAKSRKQQPYKAEEKAERTCTR